MIRVSSLLVRAVLIHLLTIRIFFESCLTQVCRLLAFVGLQLTAFLICDHPKKRIKSFPITDR